MGGGAGARPVSAAADERARATLAADLVTRAGGLALESFPPTPAAHAGGPMALLVGNPVSHHQALADVTLADASRRAGV